MTEHAACILAIVGSRDCNPQALTLIDRMLDEHKPLVVVSGGAKVNLSNRAKGLVSIDQEAARIAQSHGIQVIEFLPTNFTWAGAGGFAERNMKIAEACVCLVRIVSTTSTTYGSGWTADRAEELGKDVERFTVDDKGTITVGQPEQGNTINVGKIVIR